MTKERLAKERAASWEPFGQNHDPSFIRALRSAYETGFLAGASGEAGAGPFSKTDAYRRLVGWSQWSSAEHADAERRADVRALVAYVELLEAGHRPGLGTAHEPNVSLKDAYAKWRESHAGWCLSGPPEFGECNCSGTTKPAVLKCASCDGEDEVAVRPICSKSPICKHCFAVWYDGCTDAEKIRRESLEIQGRATEGEPDGR